MKRRNFLKLCAAAVVAPTALLKDVPFKPNPVQTMWMEGKDGSRIEGIVAKARQQGFANTHQIFFHGISMAYRSPLYDETIQETE